jgi:oxaloacetate decarboxylase alpha subunit
MNEVYLVDQTLRDGHQSLWATRMSTAMMLSIAPIIDQAGYQWADLMGAVQADAAVRYLRENPFERIRLMAKAMPNTPLGPGSEGNVLSALTSFQIWLISDALCQWIRYDISGSPSDWRNINNRYG